MSIVLFDAFSRYMEHILFYFFCYCNLQSSFYSHLFLRIDDLKVYLWTRRTFFYLFNLCIIRNYITVCLYHISLFKGCALLCFQKVSIVSRCDCYKIICAWKNSAYGSVRNIYYLSVFLCIYAERRFLFFQLCQISVCNLYGFFASVDCSWIIFIRVNGTSVSQMLYIYFRSFLLLLILLYTVL